MGNFFSSKTEREDKKQNQKLDSIIQAIKAGDYAAFSHLIDKSPPSDIKNHAELICLQISKKNRAEFKEKMITSGLLESLLFPDLSNELHNAIRAWDFEQVKTLCKLGANVNKPYYGVTPSYLTVETCIDSQYDEKTAIKIMNELIEYGADINARGKNIKDCSEDEDCTALGKAIASQKYEIAKYLLEDKKAIIINESTLQSIIKSNIKNTAKIDENQRMKFKLFNYLYNKKEDEFLNLIETNPNIPVDSNDGWYTFIQLASKENLEKVVTKLIEKQADPNKTFGIEYHAVVLAAMYGSENVLNLLFTSSKLDLHTKDMVDDTVIHKIAYLWIKRDKIKNNALECIEQLLVTAIKAGVDINAKTKYDVTALMVSSSSCNKELFTLFLNYGAFCVLDDGSLSNVEPEFLEEFLDSKISFLNVPNNLLNGASVHRPMLDYGFVKSNENSDKFVAASDELDSVTTKFVKNNKKTKLKHYPEMTPLYTISKSIEHRHLLNHPIIANFLQLKWLKIYHIYLANVLFYLFFTIFFSLYVHDLHYYNHIIEGNSTTELGNNEPYKTSSIIWYLTLIMWSIIFSRETMQMFISIREYVMNIENWLEIIMLSFSFLILIDVNNYTYTKYLSTIAIIFTYIELVYLIGRHPSVAKYVTMFTRVSQKTLFMLTCFAPLIFAFAFAFFLLFHVPEVQDVFLNVYTSMLKTFIMATGEFDAGELQFANSPGISQAVFVIFIFFIAVILINLLNALAISDTQAIIDEAELLCCIAKVNLYTEIEAFFCFESKNVKKKYGKILKKVSKFQKKILSKININVLPLDKSNECVFTILVKNPKLSYPNVTGSELYRFFCINFLGIEFTNILKNCLAIKKKIEDNIKMKKSEDTLIDENGMNKSIDQVAENNKFFNASYLGGRVNRD